VTAETNNTAALIQQDLKKANLSYTQVIVPDPAKPQVIAWTHCAGQLHAVRTLLIRPDTPTSTTWTALGQCMDADHEAAGVDGLEAKTVQQAIEPGRPRECAGVSEPVIQEYAWAPTRFWWSCRC